jgi:hypothetical protein
MKTVFGYGSLILPTAAVGNLPEIQDVDRIYQRDEELLRDDALEKWNEIREQVTVLPVKVEGYARYYSNESPRGGCMLEVFESEDEWINGVILFDLPDPLYEAVTEKEKEMGDYEVSTVPREKITPYVETDRELPEQVKLYVPREDSEKSSLETSRGKNPVYHARIMKGIEMLGDSYGREVAKEFRLDFLDTTYEKVEGEWQKLSSHDKKVG